MGSFPGWSRTALLPAAALAILGPSTAHGAPPKACTDAYDHAQLLRKQEKLLTAREQLRICAEPSCPQLIVNDCTQWLEEAQKNQPSVIPLATDEAGQNLVDVTLTIDSVALVTPVSGQPVELDPGTHQLTFEHAGFAPAIRTILVAVGEQNKRIVVTMHPAETARAKHASPLVPIGIAAAAVGVVGIGVGAVFGVSTISKKSDANCPNSLCGRGSDPAALSQAVTDGNLSTAFFIAGGVLAAAGVTLWVLAPSPTSDAPPKTAAWLTPVPTLLPGGGGLVLRGGW